MVSNIRAANPGTGVRGLGKTRRGTEGFSGSARVESVVYFGALFTSFENG